MKKISTRLLGLFVLALMLLIVVNSSQAMPLSKPEKSFQRLATIGYINEHFRHDVFATGEWARTDASVTVDAATEWMRIASDGNFGDYASQAITLTLPITVETRMRLVSGGNDYTFPTLNLYYDLGLPPFSITYNTQPTLGWNFGNFTAVANHGPEAENIWTTIRAVIRPDGGDLYAKFDGEPDYTFVTTGTFSVPSDFIEVRLTQNWDAPIDVDYIKVTSATGVYDQCSIPGFSSQPTFGTTFPNGFADLDALGIGHLTFNGGQIQELKPGLRFTSSQTSGAYIEVPAYWGGDAFAARLVTGSIYQVALLEDTSSTSWGGVGVNAFSLGLHVDHFADSGINGAIIYHDPINGYSVWPPNFTLSSGQELLVYFDLRNGRVSISDTLGNPIIDEALPAQYGDANNVNKYWYIGDHWSDYLYSTSLVLKEICFLDRSSADTHYTSGQIVDSNNLPLAGVTVAANNGLNTTTDANGNYTLTGFLTGVYTITPSLGSYTFSPPERNISLPPDAVGQDFIGLALLPPTDVRARTSIDSIMLDWTPSANPYLEGYNIYRRPISTTTFVKINMAPVVGDSWADADPGLVSGTMYEYYLTAVGDGQESAPSAIVSTTFGQVQLYIPDLQGQNQISVTVPINIANATGISIDAMDVYVTYDPAVVSIPSGDLTRVQRTILTLNYGFAVNVVSPGVARIALATGMGGETLQGPGTLFNLIFDVPGNNGATSTLEFDVVHTDLYANGDLFTPVPLSLINGSFLVEPGYILGDLNGDGIVNSADAAIALQISAGLIVPTPEQLVAGDVNGDGTINAADAALIMRMAAGLPLLPPGTSTTAMNTPSGPVNLSMPQVSAMVGQIVSIPVSISSAANVAGGDLVINYDPTFLTVETVSNTVLTANFNVAYAIPTPGALRISLAPKEGYENGLISGAGDLVLVNFKINAAAEAGLNTPINLTSAHLNDTYSRDFSTSALQTDINLTSGQIIALPKYKLFLAVIKR